MKKQIEIKKSQKLSTLGGVSSQRQNNLDMKSDLVTRVGTPNLHSSTLGSYLQIAQQSSQRKTQHTVLKSPIISIHPQFHQPSTGANSFQGIGKQLVAPNDYYSQNKQRLFSPLPAQKSINTKIANPSIEISLPNSSKSMRASEKIVSEFHPYQYSFLSKNLKTASPGNILTKSSSTKRIPLTTSQQKKSITPPPPKELTVSLNKDKLSPKQKNRIQQRSHLSPQKPPQTFSSQDSIPSLEQISSPEQLTVKKQEDSAFSLYYKNQPNINYPREIPTEENFSDKEEEQVKRTVEKSGRSEDNSLDKIYELHSNGSCSQRHKEETHDESDQNRDEHKQSVLSVELPPEVLLVELSPEVLSVELPQNLTSELPKLPSQQIGLNSPSEVDCNQLTSNENNHPCLHTNSGDLMEYIQHYEMELKKSKQRENELVVKLNGEKERRLILERQLPEKLSGINKEQQVQNDESEEQKKNKKQQLEELQGYIYIQEQNLSEISILYKKQIDKIVFEKQKLQTQIKNNEGVYQLKYQQMVDQNTFLLAENDKMKNLLASRIEQNNLMAKQLEYVEKGEKSGAKEYSEQLLFQLQAQLENEQSKYIDLQQTYELETSHFKQEIQALIDNGAHQSLQERTFALRSQIVKLEQENQMMEQTISIQEDEINKRIINEQSLSLQLMELQRALNSKVE